MKAGMIPAVRGEAAQGLEARRIQHGLRRDAAATAAYETEQTFRKGLNFSQVLFNLRR
jgi:hypothetical protein